jgi:hypothetical protein
MLLRISAPRPPLPLSLQTCLCQQTRSYRNQLFRKPQVFYQNIVLTDGSSFKVMTCSPRKTYRLTRDKFNNPLWTGRRRSSEEDEQNQQLAKFRKSFSGAIGGEDSMKQLREERRRKDPTTTAKSGDLKVETADALFSMLESKEAYVPTRGREGKDLVEPTGKTKGVRT